MDVVCLVSFFSSSYTLVRLFNNFVDHAETEGMRFIDVFTSEIYHS